MALTTLENRRFLAGMILCYTAMILASVSVRPLWTDEVLQLSTSWSAPSLRAMFESIRIGIGAVPLGYLTQRPVVLAAGPSAFWARLPSVLFSIASCVLLIRICMSLNIARTATAIAIGIFMIAPSQLRYAMEGRPYAESMFFGLLAAMMLEKLARNPRIITAVAAALALLAGLYTQAYVFFFVSGIALGYAIAFFRRGDRKNALLPIGALTLAAMLFAPWYILNSQVWQERARLGGYPDFHWTQALAVDFVKGLSGGSLVCSVALVLLAAAGVCWGNGERGILLWAALPAVVGPLLTDSAENYFFASRQILYAIPAVAILAGLGVVSLFRRSRMAGIAGLAVFSIAALVSDVTFQIRSKEDWPAAARALAGVARNGYCIQPAVDLSGAVEMYSVFEPRLASMTCGPTNAEPRLAFLSNFTMDSARVAASFKDLQARGYVARETIQTGGATIVVAERMAAQAVR